MASAGQAVMLGAEVGFCAAIAQAVAGEALNERLLPEGRRADVALRLVQTVVADGEHPEPDPFEFLGACAFHFGYGAFWGAVHGYARERLGVHPALCAGGLAALIYGLAFSRAGGGVMVGSEPPPHRRTRGELAYEVAVASAFAVSNALLFEWARR